MSARIELLVAIPSWLGVFGVIAAILSPVSSSNQTNTRPSGTEELTVGLTRRRTANFQPNMAARVTAIRAMVNSQKDVSRKRSSLRLILLGHH